MRVGTVDERREKGSFGCVRALGLSPSFSLTSTHSTLAVIEVR